MSQWSEQFCEIHSATSTAVDRPRVIEIIKKSASAGTCTVIHIQHILYRMPEGIYSSHGQP